MTRRRWTPLLSLWIVSGCGGYLSGKEQFVVGLGGLRGDPTVPTDSRAIVVEGSRYCPETLTLPGDPSTRYDCSLGTCVLRSCFEWSVTKARLDEECIVFDQVGEVRWSLTRNACRFEQLDRFERVEELVDDWVDFEVVETGGLRAQIDLTITRLLLQLDPGPAETFPPDLSPTADEPLRVAAGSPFARTPVLVQDQGEIVDWGPNLGDYVFEPRAGEPTLEFDEESGAFSSVNLGVGDELDVGIDLEGRRFETGGMLGVDPAEADTLEIVVGYDAPAAEWDDDYGIPVGAMAIVRDDQGRRIHATEVRWQLSGVPWTLSPGDPTVDPVPEQRDVIGFSPGCRLVDRDTAYRVATLTATVGDLSESVTMIWFDHPDEEADDEELPPCSSGDLDSDFLRPSCGCTSDPSNSGPLWLFTLLLGLGFRRRTSTRTWSMTTRPERPSCSRTRGAELEEGC